MERSCYHAPILSEFYQQYLADADIMQFRGCVESRYTPATLEHLVEHREVSVRRAAVLALGLIGDFRSNTVLGAALRDSDSITAILAEVAIRTLWKRDATPEAQEVLRLVTELNTTGNLLRAIAWANAQLDITPSFAELRYQRGKAWFQLGNFQNALDDFLQTLMDNPLQFDAARMAAHCFMELGRTRDMLNAFRLAVRINPNLKMARISKPLQTPNVRE